MDDGMTDGHNMVHEAVDRGASGVVVERWLPVEIPQFVVDDTRVAFGRICHALAGSPSSHLCSIGVTGTHGKTVTEMLMLSVLEEAGCQAGAIGSLGYCDGFETASPGAGSDVVETMTWLARMRSQGCSHAVIEASSEALATKKLSGIEYNAVVVTNIRRAHLDLHGSVSNYRRAKTSILEHLKPGGIAIVNADDPGCKRLLPMLACPVLTFSMKQDAEITASLIERCQSEQTFLIHAGSDSMPIRTAMIGDHHIQNCLAAAALGLSFGMDLPLIARALETVTSLPARLERIECGQDFGVFVDCGQTPEAIASVMSTLREVTTGRLICVAAPAGDVSSEERAQLGRVLDHFADESVLTAAELSSESDSQQIHDVLDGFDRPAQARWLPNRTKAICWALGEASCGDTVLISGGTSSFLAKDQNQRCWNDRDIARYWLLNIGTKKVSPWMAA
jgi:UDP-N-acetylmuramoyl-L-alanyl-D-glutamate--2,6-diaminopimelate ligase